MQKFELIRVFLHEALLIKIQQKKAGHNDY